MNDTQANSLGRYLRVNREAAGLTIRELARLAQVDHGYIIRLESGDKRNPSADVLHKLAGVLELDPTEVLDFIGVAPSASLPPARVYFRKKYGLSDADTDQVLRQIEHYLAQDKDN